MQLYDRFLIIGVYGFLRSLEEPNLGENQYFEQNRPIFEVLRNFPGHQVVGSPQKWPWTFIIVISTNLSWGMLYFDPNPFLVEIKPNFMNYGKSGPNRLFRPLSTAKNQNLKNPHDRFVDFLLLVVFVAL